MTVLIRTLFILLMTTLLAGCSYLMDSETNNLQNDTCRSLKRQLIFNERDNSPEADNTAPSQRAALREQLEEYGCIK